MSYSSGSESPPNDAQLEHALREAVRSVFETGKMENLTVKRLRNHVETNLGLEPEFFKSNDQWKEKSKNLIQQEVDAHDEVHKSSHPQPSSPGTAAKPPSKSASSLPKSTTRGVKRSSTEPAEKKPKKRRKKSTPDVDESMEEQKQAVTERPNAKPDPERKLSPEPGTEEEPEDKQSQGEVDTGEGPDAPSESEMSIVLDEEPNPKKRRRKSDTKPKAKKTGTAKSKRPPEGAADPESEEIKRLQGWLVKCGIRKMWYKELAPYDSPKAKIKHLKGMLGEAGMTGRYSKEKADQIREERELKADLEAVQEGAKAWGTAGDEDEQGDGKLGSRPRRRLATGLQGLDFLNDDDGEETD